VHLAIKVPATLMISKWIGELKGATSYNLSKAHPEISFAWQSGYGVSSFSGKDLDAIIRYIQNQELHHLKGSIKDEFELN
jgi:REP element-mobilizing transposase RayT